jgi:hypothetical protein
MMMHGGSGCGEKENPASLVDLNSSQLPEQYQVGAFVSNSFSLFVSSMLMFFKPAQSEMLIDILIYICPYIKK